MPLRPPPTLRPSAIERRLSMQSDRFIVYQWIRKRGSGTWNFRPMKVQMLNFLPRRLNGPFSRESPNNLDHYCPPVFETMYVNGDKKIRPTTVPFVLLSLSSSFPPQPQPPHLPPCLRQCYPPPTPRAPQNE